jgi:hypothetical protein
MACEKNEFSFTDRNEVNTLSPIPETESMTTPIKFQGFCTGKGSRVKISESAVKKVQAMGIFSETMDNRIEEFSPTRKSEIVNNEVHAAELEGHLSIDSNKDVLPFRGFVSGNGREMKISQKALNRASEILESIDDNEEKRPKLSQKSNAEGFGGFLSGKGKACVISESSMRKARNILSETPSHDKIDVSTPLKKSILPSKVSVHQTPMRSFSNLLKSTPYKTPDLLCSKLMKKRTREPIKSPLFSPVAKVSSKSRHNNEPKKFQKKSLSDFVCGLLPGTYSCQDLSLNPHFPMEAIQISSLNSEEYRFSSTFGWKEAHDSIASEISGFQMDELWTKNHYRWIVWKYASYCRSFPNLFSSYFSFNQVCQQLKHRYEIEMENGKSSAIKQILQRDEFPSRFMILVVASIDKCSGENCKGCFELSDGWYGIKSVPDLHLHRILAQGKLCEGQKIRIFGAALTSSSPCLPLENKDNMLRM